MLGIGKKEGISLIEFRQDVGWIGGRRVYQTHLEYVSQLRGD